MKHKEPSDEAVYRIIESLENRYNKLSKTAERNEHGKDECRGGYRFASLIETVRECTEDRKILREAWKTLFDIADHPCAGSISWEMRRYIRKAPSELFPEFFQVIREYAKIIRDYCPIDMDFFYWDAKHGDIIRARESLEGLKQGLERLKAHKESELESED